MITKRISARITEPAAVAPLLNEARNIETNKTGSAKYLKIPIKAVPMNSILFEKLGQSRPAKAPHTKQIKVAYETNRSL